MADYSHLTFLQHTQSSTTTGVDDPWGDFGVEDKRSDQEKHADVVDYLLKLTSGQWAHSVDVEKVLGIFLKGKDHLVLRWLRTNPKVEIKETDSGEFYRYRAKYDITNRNELMKLIDRHAMGISLNDVKTAYKTAEQDVEKMLVGGDIIACKNKEKKDQTLFPRKRPFLAQLSGTASYYPGKSAITTDKDVSTEIRRGDAIGVGDNWFRIDMSLEGARTNQPERARPPLSVCHIPLPEKAAPRKYDRPFTSTEIPLDGVVDSMKKPKKDRSDLYEGPAVKHGVTNDIKTIWDKSMEGMRKFRSKEMHNSLETELIRLNLLSRKGQDVSLFKDFGQRQKRVKQRVKRKSTNVSNTHLAGTEIGALLEQMREEQRLNPDAF